MHVCKYLSAQKVIYVYERLCVGPYKKYVCGGGWVWVGVCLCVGVSVCKESTPKHMTNVLKMTF